MSSNISTGTVPAAVGLYSASPAYQSSGLNSGMNDSGIISSIMSGAQLPLTQLQSQQQAVQTKISTLGSISSSLSALAAAAASLKNGVAAVTANSNTTSFFATATSAAQVGTYSVQVGTLATAAKALSQQFGSATSAVTGGTLSLDVQGTTTPITIADGESLSDVATAINQSGAGVAAAVLNTGSGYYLSLTNSQTGYPLGGAPGSGLSISEMTTGTLGQGLGLAVTQQAKNASFTVDNLSFQRMSNTVGDALPGVTFNLQVAGGAAENLQLSTDVSGTQAALQNFCAAYNGVIQQLNAQLAPAVGTDPTTVLTGDATLENLQKGIQGLITATVPGLSTVSSLAAAGVTTAEDGTLSVNAKVLQRASANPGQLNSLFSTATTGVAALSKGLVSRFADPLTGQLSEERSGLKNTYSNMGAQAQQMAARLMAQQAQITAEFTQMESDVGNMKNIGSYLTALSNAAYNASHS